MLTKTIKIDDKEVLFAASAAIPRIYRIQFRRDIFQDMAKIEKSVKKSQDKQTETKVSESDIPIEDLEMFENVAFVMAKHAAQKKGQDFPEDVYDWLDQFDTFSIYTIFPEIVKLWNLNQQTQAEAKKKLRPSSREMTTPLFLLRCAQVGISIQDLDLLTVGLVLDIFTEKNNDDYQWPKMATQEDMDKF